jgi:hypothetical protein
MFSQTLEDYPTAVEIDRTVRGKATMSNGMMRTPRGVLCLAIAVGMAWIGAGPATAQTVIYDSRGFEPPAIPPGPFNTGPLATFYIPPATGGQDGWLTTDLNQQFGGAGNGAGQIVTANPFAGTQAFRIDGTKLFQDMSFGNSTLWFRNAAAGAINPVASGTPFVTVSTRQRVDSSGITIADMAFVGIYLEGYTATGTQQTLTSVLRNVNTGGITVVGPSPSPLAAPVFYDSAPNIWSTNTYHNLQATLNFNTTGPGAQTVSVTLDGTPITFTPAGGSPTATVPFRNSNFAGGQAASIAEYGFQAIFNPNSSVNTGSATFDNFLVTRAAVPEPASILAVCGVAAAAGWRLRRRKAV